MNKLLTISYIFWLLLSTSGFALQKHYCMGELDHTSLKVMPGQHQGACGCNSDTPSPCCENDEKHFQTDQDYSSADFSFQFHKTFAFAFVQTVFREAFISGHDAKSLIFREYSPPALNTNIPVSIQSFLL